MFLIVVLTVLWIIHGYVAWKVIPTLGLTSSGGITLYILVFFLSILPLLPILLRYSGSETKIIDRISLVGYTSLGFLYYLFNSFNQGSFWPCSNLCELSNGFAARS
ncbi:MAG: hypothetical protein CM15mP52_2540 [Candidatus Neomarinimicrobiota bacterium]|nr:MAG: hypothetical protein CM15mP52_2540 [Candidatus Neomarinimicrobiota bacterium]